MEVTLLIKSVMGLIVLLAILMFLLFSSLKKKKNKVMDNLSSRNISVSKKKVLDTDLQYLKSIIKDKKTTSKELQQTLNLVIKHHGTINSKLGLRTHPDFNIYMDILFTICRHPNTNKDILINFDRELERLNPEYKKEINDAITKGLNSRRV